MAVEAVDRSANGAAAKCLLPARYLMAIMGSVGLAIVYGFKVNVSVAIVAMVNHTAIKIAPSKLTTHLTNGTLIFATPAPPVCDTEGVTSKHTAETNVDGPFPWNESLQGLILSAYFWGYIITQLPGGRVAELFSARWVMNGSVILNAVASVLSPLAAQLHVSLFIIMRFAQGLGGGVTFPAMHVMISKWAPPEERSILSSIVYAGTALGTVISILLSGVLAANLGWASVFYIEGALSLIWCIGWAFIVQDSPESQTRFITQGEKDYIATSLGQSQSKAGTKKKPPVPWRQVITSLPFLAILVSHVCSNFGWYMLLTELPTFMNQILKFNMNENAALSAMPFLCMWFFTMILSKTLAIMQSKHWISISVSRKIATLFASFVPMICLIGVCYVGCNRNLAVVLMTIGVTCIGGMYCGFLSNHIDIAPNFAGTLVAITNTFATIPGFIVPIFVGKLTEGNQTIEAWRIIFFVTVGLYIVEILAYTIFGSAEEQPWNESGVIDEESPDQTVPLKERHAE
ncbi:putative inorganic phosphate cotransporter isoform X2 [Athalia rosae]|uniref:putative inorganic phosphate cotransporter isoform X2 n=1 Tax=Athalia rosae TaxID=37344 RepID=UPI002033E391|nr:putative inorganic phosphate cotransporter isoform X2 [Athalia rosae]